VNPTQRKQNIFLIGPMGAGKTTIGRELARVLDRTFYDSDIEIEKRSGVDLSWIFDVEGEEGFRAREEKIIDQLTSEQRIVLATGGSAIISAENRKNLAARGLVIYLQVSVNEQMNRTTYEHRRPTLRCGNKREVLEQMADECTGLYEEIADLIFPTHQQSVKLVSKRILEKLMEGF
jgi:shikimate kinase